MIRTGKIARLPLHIRDQVNQQLLDEVPGPEILDWLNALPEVKEILAAQFAGKPISPQNLSLWRTNGFQYWMVLEVCLDKCHDTVEAAARLRDTGMTIEDLQWSVMARYAELIQNWECREGSDEPDMEKRMRALQSISAALTRIRASEQNAQKLKLAERRISVMEQAQREKSERSSGTRRASSSSESPAQSNESGDGRSHAAPTARNIARSPAPSNSQTSTRSAPPDSDALRRRETQARAGDEYIDPGAASSKRNAGGGPDKRSHGNVGATRLRDNGRTSQELENGRGRDSDCFIAYQRGETPPVAPAGKGPSRGVGDASTPPNLTDSLIPVTAG